MIVIYSEVKVKSFSRIRLCDPVDCSLPGSSFHGIFQTRVLEWVAIFFSRGSSQPRDWTWFFLIPGRRFNLWAHVLWLFSPWVVSDSFATPRTVACQNSPGKNPGVCCHLLLQGILLTQGLNPRLLHWQVVSLWLSQSLWLSRSLCCSVMSNSLLPHDSSLPGFSDHGDSPGKNTGVGCHYLLQGIFPTQGLNLAFSHCRQIP